jgi:hypothetical protein
MVGLLVAVSTAMPVFAGLAHDDVALATIAAVAGAASGAAAYLSAAKKSSRFLQNTEKCSTFSRMTTRLK